jgi:site-specific recombinase XerD
MSPRKTRKSRPVKEPVVLTSRAVVVRDPSKTAPTKPREPRRPALVPDDLSTRGRVSTFLRGLLGASAANDAARALVPWVCDALPSLHSRKAYASDLAQFVAHMAEQGIDPLDVTGDEVRSYKDAMDQAGHSAATIARALSVIRGTYRQFGAKGLVDWDRVGEIQAVMSPRVEKNTTPALSEQEAKTILHAPDTSTYIGARDYAMLFTFFVTASRCSAIASARVGDLERTDTSWYLVVQEKGKKRQRKALLQAADAVVAYLELAAIAEDLEGPLFRPVARDKKGFERRFLDRRSILHTVKKYGRQVGIDVDRIGRRGVGVHSLRKTALTNALEHGAKIEQVQQLAGHADIRTTQLYYNQKETDAEDAARHIQIG